MIRYLSAFLAIAIASPAEGQTITVDKPFRDSNGDGRVEFGTANRRAHGVPYVILAGQMPDGWVYCGPKGCDAPQIALPVVTTEPRDFGGSGQIGYGSRSNVHALRAMDAFPLRSGGAVIADVVAEQVRAFVTPEKGRATTLNDVTIDRVDVKTGKRGIYIRADSARWTIRNFRIGYIGPASAPGDIPVGIEMNGTAHDILIENGDIGGFVNTEPARYPNADGITCERGNYDITVRNVSLHDNTDGGFDCKATGVLLDNVRASRNGRNFRLWGTGRATTLHSDSPRKAHVWVSGSGGNYTIDKLVATGGGTLVDAEAGARLVIRSCDLSGWTGTTKVAGKGSVTLGAGC